ncbi:MAG: hypothetical protein JSV86_14665 [Gemmatimonadota bacterium]|nr:MAG: hypothetical protein JSV86_14665 [Gemmatimonadota bacterium]
MRFDRRSIVRTALAAVLFLALAGAAETLSLAIGTFHESRAGSPSVPADRASRHEARFAPLREQLPARGVVGYASDGLAAGSFTSLEAMQDYFLTQYSLAPLIVVRGADPPLVVGNFRTAQSALPEGTTVLRDLGDGVVLLRGVQR